MYTRYIDLRTDCDVCKSNARGMFINYYGTQGGELGVMVFSKSLTHSASIENINFAFTKAALSSNITEFFLQN